MGYKELMDDICANYQEILRGNLVGIYVHGSIAFGCFTWEKSDIDFIVVVKEPPQMQQKIRMIETLVDRNDICPQKGFEMSVVCEKYCRKFVYPTPYELHFANAHFFDHYKVKTEENLRSYCEKMQGVDPDLAAHFTVINTAGITWCGQARENVFGPVAKEEYLDSICRDIAVAKEEIEQNPVYMILNLCRVLGYLREEKVLSKKAGGQWGLKHLPEMFAPLIGQALRCYESSVEFDKHSAELQSFAGYMLEKIGK